MNRIVNSKTLLICVIGFLSLYIAPVLASEVTGSLCTGVNCPVEGTVIAAPAASVAAGTYTSTQSVSLTASGASSIHYTTDGTTPTCSTGSTYSSAVSVASSQTVKAIACYPNNNSSSVSSFAYTISVSTGGGGGGGGSFTVVASPTPTPTPTPTPSPTPTPTVSPSTSSPQGQVNSLLTQLQTLKDQLAQMTGGTGSGSPGSSAGSYSFTRNLDLGATGEDVKSLQKFLNSQGFAVAISGLGSPGNETSFFGNATRAALAKYQTSVGVSATGYLGPLTRAKIAENITPTASATAVPSMAFSRPLGAGSKGTDVTLLQNALKNEGLLNVLATGYFGPLTENAVKAFQEKYNIAKPGDSGYGFVGPKTRAKLNGLIQ